MSSAAQREPVDPSQGHDVSGNTSEADELIRLAAAPIPPKKPETPRRERPSHHRSAQVLAGLVIVVSAYALFSFATAFGVGFERARLLTRVQGVSQRLDIATIASLSGRAQDSDTPAFHDVVKKIAGALPENPDIHFIYLVGIRHREVVFLADGTDPASPDYSPPGEVYDDATPDLVRSCSNGVAYVDGPYTDKWGTWVSGFVPLKDPSTHEVVGVLGMDVNANRWRIMQWVVRIVAALGSVALAVGAMLVMRRMR